MGLSIVVGANDVVVVLVDSVVVLLVISVVTGGVDRVVAFIVCVLDFIQNVGVIVDRIDAAVKNADAVVVV